MSVDGEPRCLEMVDEGDAEDFVATDVDGWAHEGRSIVGIVVSVFVITQHPAHTGNSLIVGKFCAKMCRRPFTINGCLVRKGKGQGSIVKCYVEGVLADDATVNRCSRWRVRRS